MTEPSRIKRSNPQQVKNAIHGYFFGGGYQESLKLQAAFQKDFDEFIIDIECEKKMDTIQFQNHVKMDPNAVKKRYISI